MTKVTTKPNSELYTKGKEFLKNDGKIDQNELNQLNKIAEKNGVTADEKKYLASLKNNQQVKTIKSGKSESVQMMFPDKDKTYQDLLNTVSDKSALESLYKSGKLDKKDSNGKTILDNLKEMSSTKMKGTMDGKKLADETIAMLNDRNKITQGPHGTCGAGSVQNYLWTKDPAEMIRIVKDLARDGKAKLRDGTEMQAADKTLDWHNGSVMNDGKSTEDRTDFDILFQSSVMKSQAFLEDYTNYNVENDYSDGKSVLHGDSASDPYKVKNMLQSITGEHYDTNMFDFDKAKERVAQGKEVIAGFFTSDDGWGMHYVTILDIKDGKVKYQNTQSGTVDEMDEADFKNKMFTVISKNDTKTGKPEDETGFLDKGLSFAPLVVGVSLLNPVTAATVGAPLAALYTYKKGKQILKDIPKIPEKIKQAAVDANNRTKEVGWFKDEKGESKTAKQYIKTVEKETEQRVLKNTGNKNAAKVASKTAGSMQTAVSTFAVGSVMISNKIKKTGETIDKFSRSAKGMSRVTDVKANAILKASNQEGISTKDKIVKKATGYALKVASKASAATGYVTEKTAKAVTYVGGKIEKATGYVVQASKPVINAVSNFVGNTYAGASSAVSSVRSYFGW